MKPVAAGHTFQHEADFRLQAKLNIDSAERV